ncbi:GFA family protein [Corallococcus macrosporus]|nr:GFA family protein [Corallococcus macrosporus]
MACHCTGCQRMSSSAFSLTMAVPTPGFHILSGAPVVGGLHGASKHMFCDYCMTWMFTRPEGVDEFVNLRPTMLDNPGWVVPFIETFTNEKLPWATTPATHSYATLPDPSLYEGLMREFADKSPRPR